MKKRIVALLMCVAMVCCMFTACSDTEESDLKKLTDIVTRSKNAPMTLAIYGVTDSATTGEAIDAVELALNEISITKYNTTIELYLYPEEEYIPLMLSKLETAMNSYVSTVTDPDKIKLEKTINFESDYKYELADMTKYPEAAQSTIDIFLVFTPEEGSPLLDPNSEYYHPAATKLFDTLYAEQALVALTPYFNKNEYATLKAKSYEQFFNSVTRADWSKGPDVANPPNYVYGMPNNYVLGSYEYLILNKEAVGSVFTQDPSVLVENTELYNQLKKDLTSLYNKGKLNVQKVEAVYNSYEEYAASDDTFAIAKIKGDSAFPQVIANPNFEVIKYTKTAFELSECRESMFCISRATPKGVNEEDRVRRCLDILRLMDNDETFRNTFQYGVKGEHYQLGRDGTVYPSSPDYSMNPKYTGNMFLLYPSDNMTVTMQLLAENHWELAKKQNTEIIENKSLKK